MSQRACLAVNQLNMISNFHIMESVYLPGVHMGEIDAMSRREIHPDLSRVCPSMTSDRFVDLNTTPIIELFKLCDPAFIPHSAGDHHINFITIYNILHTILQSLE